MLSTGRYSLGEIVGFDGALELDQRGRIRHYRIRLRAAECQRLSALLAPREERDARHWYILTVTHDQRDRVRVLYDPAPQYEQRAADGYLRGDILRVVGESGSCNINVSSLGARLMVERLQAAAARMREWVELRADRRWSVVEIVPDVAAPVPNSDDHDQLTIAGEKLAAETWPADDFSDWR
jgi:hypothetical protein